LRSLPDLGRFGAMIPLSVARQRSRIVALGVLVLMAVVPASGAKAAAPALVAAAADLRSALDEVTAQFARDTGETVRIVYGSSGNFRQQIAAGAPFEMFMSADEAMVLALAKDGRTVDDGVLYAIGHIVLVVPPGSPLKLDGSLGDLAPAVAEGRLKKFAIANPEHAPYGRAAEEALKAAGAWRSIEPHLVLGENVAQAAQFALSGSTQGGIIALALALAPGVLDGARYALIPDTMHAPLRQRMVLTKRAGATAHAFYRYLQQPAARAVLKRYGFAVPGA
jgi:molybdate transport system substrate-binding protein